MQCTEERIVLWRMTEWNQQVRLKVKEQQKVQRMAVYPKGSEFPPSLVAFPEDPCRWRSSVR